MSQTEGQQSLAVKRRTIIRGNWRLQFAELSSRTIMCARRNEMLTFSSLIPPMCTATKECIYSVMYIYTGCCSSSQGATLGNNKNEKQKNEEEERNTHEYNCSNTQHEKTNEKKTQRTATDNTRRIVCCSPAKYNTTHNMRFPDMNRNIFFSNEKRRKDDDARLPERGAAPRAACEYRTHGVGYKL